ncbi:MAG: TetR/AcrR family transcriptional regulator, partial [Mycobacterium sp.]
MTERGRRARAEIVDAAAALIYQRGVRATTLDDVLAAAGCGKSQLYHYFDDKADLVGAVIDRQSEFVLAAQPALLDIDSWRTFDHWLGGIVQIHSAPGGPFS